jgi:hypothetical protein
MSARTDKTPLSPVERWNHIVREATMPETLVDPEELSDEEIEAELKAAGIDVDEVDREADASYEKFLASQDELARTAVAVPIPIQRAPRSKTGTLVVLGAAAAAAAAAGGVAFVTMTPAKPGPSPEEPPLLRPEQTGATSSSAHREIAPAVPVAPAPTEPPAHDKMPKK